MIKYHRAQIREFFGFRENTVQDSQEMSEWLCQHILHHSQEWEHVKDTVYGRFRELCRHPDPIRYALLCAFFWLRSQEITDNLVDLLLVQIIHRISVRAERKVEKEILNDLRRVSNKYGIICAASGQTTPT
ncbi:hypothetical protein [Brevibacillus laterosporus]|uniref:hypothetical protein n=1 Tax=Brevibacillus laterosporus TaxID=1465 RepID=UPI0013159558|nr:hypothetical protein [Brevibacillus laterosporus]